MEPIKLGDAVIKKFSQVTASLLAKMAKNERKSCILAALRNTLFPKLNSGELRVKDAGRILGRKAV